MTCEFNEKKKESYSNDFKKKKKKNYFFEISKEKNKKNNKHFCATKHPICREREREREREKIYRFLL